MTVSLIVAVSDNNIIGRNDTLPWHLPKDLRRFRALTLGATVLMGRKTYESIGRPLPDRTNLVASRTASMPRRHVCIVRDVRYELFNIASGGACVLGNVFVIGGAEVYREALPFCDRAYVTRVHTTVEGEGLVRFPCDLSGWGAVEREEHGADDSHAHPFTFETLVRP